MQETLLDKYPEADVSVYAIWFSMYPTDRRENWPEDVLDDPRVRHWWDERKSVGRWYMQHVEEMRGAMAPASSGFAGDVLWDAAMVYGPEARWEGAPTGLRRWGRTILRTREDLHEAFTAVLQNGT